MLRRALTSTGLPVLGAVPRQTKLSHPSRHLGLVQAQERPDLDQFLEAAADIVEQTIDLDELITLAAALPHIAHKAPPDPASPDTAQPPLQPLAQRIAVAQDAAFAFAYPHMLDDWHRAGAEITPFSPLADDPAPAADLIFLPGGYPELYAARLSANQTFLQSLRTAARTTEIYGECGGYMVLGEALTDARGITHAMAGLLRLETSFATRKLHLGYRDLMPLGGPFHGAQKGHEFHYCSTIRAEGTPLFLAKDAEGTDLPPMGLRAERVCGSFAHVINPAF
jgi:cobyrinic acid a,c-diamide synthase